MSKLFHFLIVYFGTVKLGVNPLGVKILRVCSLWKDEAQCFCTKSFSVSPL